MISRMMKLVNATDNVYLSPPQQKELVDYAKSLNERFDAAKAVEQNEAKLIETTISLLQDNYPEIGDVKDAGWDTHNTDLQFQIRSLVQGMLVDDTQHVNLVSSLSLARQLSHLDFSDEATEGVFQSLRQSFEDTLPPKAFDLLQPYLTAMTAKA